MPSKEDKHFESYREQTRLKHLILAKYLPAYMFIRAKGAHENLVYIDGFAGAGSYADDTGQSHPGSPILALQVFADAKGDVGKRITSIFIEKKKSYFQQLEVAVAEFMKTHPQLRQPKLFHGEFADELDGIANVLSKTQHTIAPGFLFADPCGVDGLSFATLTRYINESGGEALLFFNYDGLVRIAGLGFVPEGALSEVFGGDARARQLVSFLADKTPSEKEAIIVSYYLDCLRSAIPDLYCAAFRVEREDARKTSHYLLHITRKPLGFRIMKEIMWPLGRTTEGDGAMALEQASVKGTRTLFRTKWEDVKAHVLGELSANGGRLSVKYFYNTLSERADNTLCAPAYRKALLELEAAGKITVNNDKGVATTALTRKKRNGEPTLSDTHTIVLR